MSANAASINSGASPGNVDRFLALQAAGGDLANAADHIDGTLRIDSHKLTGVQPLGLSWEIEPRALLTNLTGSRAQMRAALATLVNAFCTSTARRIVLILDDLHRIEKPSAFELLDSLIELQPRLCAALTQRADSRQVLESLYRRNLFLTAVDELVPVLRFHDMFREFLEAELQRRDPALKRAHSSLLEDWRQWDESGAPPVAPGKPGGLLELSAREYEVLAEVAAGASNKHIARKLSLSLHTVKRHIANILDKPDCDSRGQAADRFRRAA